MLDYFGDERDTRAKQMLAFAFCLDFDSLLQNKHLASEAGVDEREGFP